MKVEQKNRFIKVWVHTWKKPVILKVKKDDGKIISGMKVNKEGDEILKGGRMNLVILSYKDIKKKKELDWNKKYGWLE